MLEAPGWGSIDSNPCLSNARRRPGAPESRDAPVPDRGGNRAELSSGTHRHAVLPARRGIRSDKSLRIKLCIWGGQELGAGGNLRFRMLSIKAP